MHNIKSYIVRGRLTKAFELISSADATKTAKLRELWAIMSDIELWMEDVELRLSAQESRSASAQEECKR